MVKFLRTMMLAVAMLLPLASQAQATLTVADSTATNNYVPVYGLYLDEPLGCQSIYPASMLTDMIGENILSLQYYVSSGTSSNWGSKPMLVKMMITDSVDLSSGYIDITNATTVFSGYISAGDATVADGFTVNLTAPFMYTGGNLLVSFQINPYGDGGYSSISWYGISLTAASRSGYGSTNYDFSADGTIRTFLPKTTFSYGEPPTCFKVTGLSVTGSTASSLTLSWVDALNTGATYNIYDLSDTTLVQSGITDTFYTVTGLNSNTTYTFAVVSNCGAGDYSTMTAGVSGHTNCDAITIPFTEDFEVTSTTLSCWTTDGPGLWSVGTGDYTSSTGAFSGSTNAFIVHNSTGDVTKLISPILDGAENGMQLQFAHIERSWSGDIDELRVYYREDADSAWQMVAEYTDAYTAWQFETINITSSVYQIAFEMTDSYGYGVAIDSVVFKFLPSCVAVSNLTAGNITTTGATLSWTGNASSYNVYAVSATDTTFVQSVSDDSIVLSGLDAMTQYIYAVASDCSGDESEMTYVTFTTGCAAITIPFTENFETNSTTMACWTAYGDNVNMPVSEYGYNGSNAFVFGYTVNPSQFLISPELSGTTDGIMFEFGYKTGGNYYGNEIFSVGYSTTTSDTTAFTWGTEQSVYNTDYARYYEVMNVSGIKYVAIKYSAYDANYLAIDSVEVKEIPGCLAVNALVATGITSTGATLTWTGNASSYNVYAVSDTDTTFVQSVTADSIVLSGLSPMTEYTYAVASNCNGEESDMIYVTFTTACGAVAIPFVEDFEATSATLGCWSLANIASNTGLAGSSYSYSGEYCFLFAYNTNPPQYLISPELSGTGNGIKVEFMYKVQSTSYPESFVIGYSTTTNDTSAFVWGTEQTNLTNTSYQLYEEILGTANIKYVAIKYTANDMYYLFIDSVVVKEAPNCLPASALAVTAATNNSVSISWTGTAASYNLYNGTTFVANVATTNYTFTGLTAATNYTFGVEAVCTGNETAPMATISASTECDIISTFPYVQDFNATPACWNTIDADGDGYTWNLFMNGTTPVFNSRSYDNNIGPLTPDNWLVSPQFALAAGSSYEVTWEARPQDVNYAAEHYGLFISTTSSTDTTAFTMLQEWTLTSNDNPSTPVVNLDSYAGQNVYLALRHWNCTDEYWLVIDNFTLRHPASSNEVTISVNSNNAFYGTVSGGGIYTIGDNVTLTATPADGYYFIRWDDANGTTVSTDNPYTFVAATDLTLQAIFSTSATLDSMMVTVAVNDPTLGTTNPAPGVHYFYEGQNASVVAIPNAGNHLEGWSILVTSTESGTLMDTTLTTSVADVFELFGGWQVEAGDGEYVWTVTANFAGGTVEYSDSVTLITSSNNANWGTIIPAAGTHTYTLGDVVALGAIPAPGYYIAGAYTTVYVPMYGYEVTDTLTADDLEIEPGEMLVDTLVVDEEIIGFTLSIHFLFAPLGSTEPDSAWLTIAVNDPAMGTTNPAPGTYHVAVGEMVTVTAIANENYQLSSWSTGATTGEVIVTVNADMTLTANFVPKQGIDDVESVSFNLYGREGEMVLQGAEGHEVYVFDITGRLIHHTATAAQTEVYAAPTSGVYLVKVVGVGTKRVVIVR